MQHTNFFFFLIIKSAAGSYLVSMLFLLHSHARLAYTLPQISYPKKKKRERERERRRESSLIAKSGFETHGLGREEKRPF